MELHINTVSFTYFLLFESLLACVYCWLLQFLRKIIVLYLFTVRREKIFNLIIPKFFFNISREVLEFFVSNSY